MITERTVRINITDDDNNVITVAQLTIAVGIDGKGKKTYAGSSMMCEGSQDELRILGAALNTQTL